MRIALSERFQRDVRALGEPERVRAFDVILSLPKAVGEPHLHSGLGLRKVHSSGIWEGRVGLGLRVVFTLDTELLTLVRIANHDEVRRFLRDL